MKLVQQLKLDKTNLIYLAIYEEHKIKSKKQLNYVFLMTATTTINFVYCLLVTAKLGD